MTFVKLTPMRYEVSATDSRGRPSYRWRMGYLPKGPNGQDIYQPVPWSEALSETKSHHPEAKIIKGE